MCCDGAGKIDGRDMTVIPRDVEPGRAGDSDGDHLAYSHSLIPLRFDGDAGLV